MYRRDDMTERLRYQRRGEADYRNVMLAFSYSYSGTSSAGSEAMQTNGVPSQMSGVVRDVHQHPGLAAVSEIPGITESSGKKLGRCA
jgi:hypothetical protein